MDIKKPTDIRLRTKACNPRISEAICKRIDFHIQAEHEAAYLYKSAYAWCDYNGLFKAAEMFKTHVSEELSHADRLISYALDKDYKPCIEVIRKQTQEFKDFKDVITAAFEHEKYVTSIYKEFADMALKEKDFVTFEFVSWYLKEQVEEEALFQNILDKIEMLDREGTGIFILEEELEF